MNLRAVRLFLVLASFALLPSVSASPSATSRLSVAANVRVRPSARLIGAVPLSDGTIGDSVVALQAQIEVRGDEPFIVIVTLTSSAYRRADISSAFGTTTATRAAPGWFFVAPPSEGSDVVDVTLTLHRDPLTASSEATPPVEFAIRAAR